MANVDESNVVLRWDAPEDDGGRPLSGYRVWRCTQTSASAQIAVVAANSRTFADSDVRSRGAYRYHVTALNDIAESLPGNEANITVCFRPSPPCHLRGTAAVGAIVLNWSSPEDDGGAPVLGYNIYCSEAKGSNCLIEILGAGVRGYLHEGLSSLFQYSYEVTAFNKAGESARSNTAQAVPLAPPQAVEPGLLADTQPPWIIISEPLDGSVLHSARITVSGQASDDRGLALVELSNGGSIWHAASGTTGWKRTVTLSKGPNIIFAKATDGQGNTALVHVTVKYEPAKSASTVNVPLASALLVLAAGLAYGIWALRRSRQGGP
jgi:hypothetical protein